MAYLRDIESKCHAPGCKSRATHELVDRWNDARGQYCNKHATAGLKRQKSNEQEPDGDIHFGVKIDGREV